MVRKYYAVDEAISTSAEVPLDRYYEVASGKYAVALLQSAQLQRSKKYRVFGKVKVGTPHIDTLVPSSQKVRTASAIVAVCLDVRNVRVVNSRGVSVVDPTRAKAYTERLKLRREAVGWRVVDGEDKAVSKCVA